MKFEVPSPTVRTFLMSAVIEGGAPSLAEAPMFVDIFPSNGLRDALLSISVPAIPFMLDVTPNALLVPTERVALDPLETFTVTDWPGPASISGGRSGAVWAIAKGATTA